MTAVSRNAQETLEIIREEQISPAASTVFTHHKGNSHSQTQDNTSDKCHCLSQEKQSNLKRSEEQTKVLNQEARKSLENRENELRSEFEQQMEKNLNILKLKFDLILHNEQVRASQMLQEAHRERQEKISALQSQLQCKNIAALMYVLCTERRKGKLEKIELVEQYTNYIESLHEILEDAQNLILNLSRGYKTAARVDYEWQQKMKNVICEFQNFVYHFVGGGPETNQYFFDLPKLLHTESPIKDNPLEDPCDEDEPVINIEDLPENKTWWEMLEGDDRPFVVFGDMANFNPEQRRKTLKSVKGAKVAPKKWKEYMFRDMFLKSGCPNLQSIKDEYHKRPPEVNRMECHSMQTTDAYRSPESSRRQTSNSIDIHGNMGSLLRIITSTGFNTNQHSTKATLLGARDSMEITSTTKLRERQRHSEPHNKADKIVVGNRRASFFVEDDLEEEVDYVEPMKDLEQKELKEAKSVRGDEDELLSQIGALGTHHDSLEVIPHHVPDKDSQINYQRVCPMEKCRRLEKDSFMRSLPHYMRSNPFEYIDQNFDSYEPCTPAQLEELKRRIVEKKNKEKVKTEDDPLKEWEDEVAGLGTQTSRHSVDTLPPCTCLAPSPTPVSSPSATTGKVYKMADLFPAKLHIDRVTKDCFYDSQIEFNRFKVIGQESQDSVSQMETQKNLTQDKLQKIRKVLRQHPSLCEIFQANTQC